MGDLRETAVDHVEGEGYITYFVAEKKWLNKLKKQMEKYPGEIQVVRQNNDGSLVVHLPYSWFRAPAPKAKRGPMSADDRARAVERLIAARKQK